jgi:hypothetical protein
MLLAKEGVVHIPKQLWENFANSCQLTPEVLARVKDRWVQDGDDGSQFLNKVADDYYTLGKEHSKALEFLKQQGLLRIKQSIRGSYSAAKRKKSHKKIDAPPM